MTNIKFVLVKDHKRVGYEWHRNSPAVKEIGIFHCPMNSQTWYNILCEKWAYIPHDEKFLREDMIGLKEG